jgi:TRAP-type uncharacterized transport system substrate-binding protein
MKRLLGVLAVLALLAVPALAHPATRVPQGRAAQAPPAKPDTSVHWVASSKGTTYYKLGCKAGDKLSAKNRVYFKTEAEAQSRGLARSKSKGC